MISPVFDRPVSARIDRNALRHNLAVVRKHAPRSKVFAILKANAYGHGALAVATALSDAEGFGLIEADVAVALRDVLGIKKPILLLEGFYTAQELETFIRYDLTAVVHAQEQIDMLDALQTGKGKQIRVFLKVNTGMNRVGVPPEDFASAVQRLHKNPSVELIGVMSHFASVDEPESVEQQLSVFRGLALPDGLPVSLSNSGAVMKYPMSHQDWVRAGIMLYGCSPFDNDDGSAWDLQPAMTFQSHIISIQQVRAGASVGYGRTFVAPCDMAIGNVAGGYADGYPLQATTGTPILVDGQRTQVLGRVSMDKLCVDLSSVPSARVGSEVTFWGKDLPVEVVARAAGTIGYELLARVGQRVPRNIDYELCTRPGY